MKGGKEKGRKGRKKKEEKKKKRKKRGGSLWLLFLGERYFLRLLRELEKANVLS